MLFFLVTILLTLFASTPVLANGRPSQGGRNFAFFGCGKTEARGCWPAGRKAMCGPQAAGDYHLVSVDPNGFLAGAYGDCFGIGTTCPDLQPGLKFTVRCDRAYDGENKVFDKLGLKVHVEVVNTNGYLTLNTRLDDGGGCNLPVTKQTGSTKTLDKQWEASGDYEHHCW